MFTQGITVENVFFCVCKFNIKFSVLLPLNGLHH